MSVKISFCSEDFVTWPTFYVHVAAFILFLLLLLFILGS